MSTDPSADPKVPSPDLLRQWAADPQQTQYWGLAALADRLERMQKIIEDYADHQRKSCRDLPASETGFCYCGLSFALKEAGL